MLALLTLTTLGPAAVTARADTIEVFQSPSGNIFCDLYTDEGTTHAQCDTVERSWTPPPRPANCMGANNRVSIVAGQAPSVDCHGDTIIDRTAATLQYGQTRTLNSIACSSDSAGITCRDSGTGHYFRVSRDSYELH